MDFSQFQSTGLSFHFWKALFLSPFHPHCKVVKHFEMFEILPFMQANKLACHNFIDKIRRHEILGSEKEIIIYGKSTNQSVSICAR